MDVRDVDVFVGPIQAAIVNYTLEIEMLTRDESWECEFIIVKTIPFG